MSEPRYTESEWLKIQEEQERFRQRREAEAEERAEHDRRHGYYTYEGTDRREVWHPPADPYDGEDMG